MIALTFDVDWAPDFAIDFVRDLVRTYDAPSTWFVTHSSDALQRLREEAPRVELGIHPNFLQNSTHGVSATEVLSHCMGLVPDAVSMRTHSLVQSTPLLQMVTEHTPIKLDSSLLLPRVSGAVPFRQPFAGRPLLRVPVQWEDDVEMEYEDPRWDAQFAIDQKAPLQVFNFHPIHIYLNSVTMGPYHRLREKVPSLSQATSQDATGLIHEGPGPASLLKGLLRAVPATQMCRLKDLL